MQIFVQTRGVARASDYCFLGQAPHSPWWRRYRDHTSFDHPTLIVVSDGADWRAYLSGIPSARVDAVGTVVRYTVVLEGICGDIEKDTNERAIAVIAAWLSDIGTKTADGDVQAAFDQEFPAPVVERLMTEGCGGWQETQQRAMIAISSLPPADPVADPGTQSWIGDVEAPVPRSEFVGRAAGLLAGVPGRVLFLNLIGSHEDVPALAEDDLPMAILGEGITGVPHDQIAEVTPKKAPPPPPRSNQRVAMRRKNVLLRWLAALVGGVRRWFP